MTKQPQKPSQAHKIKGLEDLLEKTSCFVAVLTIMSNAHTKKKTD